LTESRLAVLWHHSPVTERETFDWDAPLNADGPGRTDALHRALGLSIPALSSFRADLHARISSRDWGFAQLADLADVEQRALVSDQLLSAIDGLVDALVDAAISRNFLRV
ncbi:MAG: hypothetical protein ACRDPM_20820, partial [Solirubrobacteraceae bacterium]